MARLSDPITILKGIGPARAKQFENLNIFTLEDLICHFPRGYEDRTQLVTIDKLQVDIPACFRAMVMNTPPDNPHPQGSGHHQGAGGGSHRKAEPDLFQQPLCFRPAAVRQGVRLLRSGVRGFHRLQYDKPRL